MKLPERKIFVFPEDNIIKTSSFGRQIWEEIKKEFFGNLAPIGIICTVAQMKKSLGTHMFNQLQTTYIYIYTHIYTHTRYSLLCVTQSQTQFHGSDYGVTRGNK